LKKLSWEEDAVTKKPDRTRRRAGAKFELIDDFIDALQSRKAAGSRHDRRTGGLTDG